MDGQAKVVVTGFGPFDGISVNSSTTAVLNLQCKWEEIISQAKCSPELVVLPNIEVSYQAADKAVSHIWDELNPNLVIHVGVDPSASKISLENQSGFGPYTMTDDGCLPCQPLCHEQICTKLSLDEPCVLLQSRGFKCGISTDPGCFLCGYIYWRSLEKDPNRTLFVHVPTISDVFTADYLGDFLLLLIIILCKNCDIPISSSLADHL
ncbi:Peptidase C15 pyroglutamyl peptidase I [Echinococcus multilocularis]|uniref:Peptidase C15 pyroglutamyl peptidase I n=1 Tax=Echinococcus multilocularis TaxID=6211 RepID=A0A087W1A5_ECHMU|nr:Peptidase C15 pyroglutamyl peptidase I [Echinococcus multilocularis]